MIEAISPVGTVEATSIAFATGLTARRDMERRQRRLKWLSSLRTAMGEEAPIDGLGNRDEAIAAETRTRIAAALATIEEMRGLDGEPVIVAGASTGTVTAADLALKIVRDGDRSLRIQAHLGTVTVRHLVGGAEEIDPTVNAA